MHSQILTLIEFKSVPTCWILALLSKTQRRFGVGKRPSPGRTGHANVCYTDQQQHFLPNWVDSFNFIRSRATYDKHFDKFKLAALHIQQSQTLHFMIFNSCYKTSKYSSVMLSSVLLEMRWIRIRWIWFQFHWLMLLICRAGHTNALISTSLFTSPSSSSFDSPSFFIRFQWILLLMCQHHPTPFDTAIFIRNAEYNVDGREWCSYCAFFHHLPPRIRRFFFSIFFLICLTKTHCSTERKISKYKINWINEWATGDTHTVCQAIVRNVNERTEEDVYLFYLIYIYKVQALDLCYLPWNHIIMRPIDKQMMNDDDEVIKWRSWGESHRF